MKSYLSKKTKRENKSISNEASNNFSQNENSFQDNSTEAIQMRQLQSGIDNSEETTQLKAYQKAANDHELSQLKAQPQKNDTGIPDEMKSKMESFSGYSLDDVNVHYNSEKPALLKAHAYAQGSDIHIAPGQEQHLPHELAHIVQQKEGRVKPDNNDTNVNTDENLETEADNFGEKIMENDAQDSTIQNVSENKNSNNALIQKQDDETFEIVCSIQADIDNPLNGGTYNPENSDIATDEDAGMYCYDVDAFLNSIIQKMSDSHPQYTAISDASDSISALGDRLSPGYDVAFNSEQELNNAILNIVDVVGQIADNANRASAVNWEFSNINVSRSNPITVRFRSNIVTFLNWLKRTLQPFNSAIENSNQSQFAAGMSELLAEIPQLEDLLNQDQTLLTNPNEITLNEQIISKATTLFESMNNAPIRTINTSLPEPFEMAGMMEYTKYSQLYDIFDTFDFELSLRENLIIDPRMEDDFTPKHNYNNLKLIVDDYADMARESAESIGWDSTLSDEDAEEAIYNIQQVQFEVNEIFSDLDRRAQETRNQTINSRRELNNCNETFMNIQRQAFLHGDEASLALLAPMTGWGLTFAAELDTAMQSMNGRGMFGAQGTLAGNITGYISTIYTWGSLIKNWSSSSPLMAGSGMTELQNAVSFMDAVNGTWVNPATLFTAHIGPMLTIISAQMSQLSMRLIEQNDIWVELGHDPLYMNTEPGGDDMWRFMTRVMNVTSPTAIPAANETVLSFFEQYQDLFDASLQNENMPMDGGVLGTGLFENIDSERFNTWVFDNRDVIWINLYGSRNIPGRR